MYIYINAEKITPSEKHKQTKSKPVDLQSKKIWQQKVTHLYKYPKKYTLRLT